MLYNDIMRRGDCMYDMTCEFDLESHLETFTNYCEVVIDDYGKIHYAYPSHTKFLERYGAKINHLTETEFIYSCPENMYADYLHWLLNETSCISCWTIGYMYGDYGINVEQISSLKMLISNNLVAPVRLTY